MIDDSDKSHYRSLVNEEGMLASIGSFSMWINANDMKRYAGPYKSHIIPPRMGAIRLPNPLANPIIPYHPPSNSLGTSSAVMAPCVTAVNIIEPFSNPTKIS